MNRTISFQAYLGGTGNIAACIGYLGAMKDLEQITTLDHAVLIGQLEEALVAFQEV